MSSYNYSNNGIVKKKNRYDGGGRERMLDKRGHSELSSNNDNNNDNDDSRYELNSVELQKQTLDEEEKSHTLATYYLRGDSRSNSANAA